MRKLVGLGLLVLAATFTPACDDGGSSGRSEGGGDVLIVGYNPCKNDNYSQKCVGACPADHSCLYNCVNDTVECFDNYDCTEYLACQLKDWKDVWGSCEAPSGLPIELMYCAGDFLVDTFDGRVPQTLANALDYCAEEHAACVTWMEENHAGDAVYWDLIKIVDDPANTISSCGNGSPGADIDGVEVYHDGEQIGVEQVDDVIDDIWSQWWPCDNAENLHDDLLVLAGFPGGGTYFSLNGRTVILRMSEALADGDELVVHEIFDAQNPDESFESYKVFLGYYDDEFDSHFMDEPIIENTGMATATISGLW